MNYEERLFRQKQGYECYYAAIPYIIAAVTAATEVRASQVQATNQEEYQQHVVEANNKVIHNQEAAVRAQAAQDAEARALANNNAQIASIGAKSTAKVATGEAGIAGNTVDALLAEYDAHLGQYRDATARQGQLNDVAASTQIEALRLGNNFSNLQINAPVAGPNYAAITLRAAATAYGAYTAQNPGGAAGSGPKTTPVSKVPATKSTPLYSGKVTVN